MCEPGRVKPFKSNQQLVTLIRDERGLTFGMDEEAAMAVLSRVNYYRFTGYSRHFQEDPRAGKNAYVPNATFEKIIALLDADDATRMRLFVALSDVELNVRTRFAHIAGRIYGEKAFYLDVSNHISDRDETHRRIDRVKRDLQESKLPTVARYRKSDLNVSEVPIWVAIEVLSFGKVAWLLESLTADDVRDETADSFSFTRSTFPRTLQSLADLRNLCAHHGQLWNRNLTSQCPLPINKRERPRDLSFHHQSIYPALMALHKLVRGTAARTQMRVVEKTMRRGDEYALGLLRPQGVR